MTTTRRQMIQRAAAAAAILPTLTPFRAEAASRAEGTAFLEAARLGNAERLRELLASNPRLVASRDASGRTAFAIAHLHHQPEAGAVLTEHGYEPDAHESALAGDWDRFTTLTEADPALVNRDHPIGGTAMLAGALGGAGSSLWRVYAAMGEPNLAPDEGLTPLQAALLFPDLGTAELTAATLLGNSADPNAHGGGQPPALHIAARRGSTALVEMLIRRGARPDASDAQGNLPIELAGRSRRRDVVSLLENHSAIPRTHSTSRTATAANGKPYSPPDLIGLERDQSSMVGQSHFDVEAVRETLDKRPRLAHSRATTGEYAVEAGAHTGRREIVDLLLEHGAAYSLPTAVILGDRSRVMSLLDEDPLRRYERGPHDFALLWYPVIGRDLELLELLLQRGCQVEEQHYLGTTALHFAALRGSTQTIELLLDHGADLNRVGRKFSGEGQTPLDCAVARENDEAADFLRSRGAKTS